MALWLVATPIGTLGDASPRSLQVLGSADVVACEDTRNTRKLLGLLGVKAPELVAVHAHNEDAVAERLVKRAKTETVALVSDAGTPGVSDPGSRVVTLAHAEGVQVLSVPGPSALASALAASGFPAAPSRFIGFPVRKGRDAWVDGLLSHPETVVIYEAPGRLRDLVDRIAVRLPSRELCMCREISKRFEEVVRLPARQLSNRLAAGPGIRGECVLVVGPGAVLTEQSVSVAADASLKEIAAALALRTGQKRRTVYQMLLDWERTL